MTNPSRPGGPDSAFPDPNHPAWQIAGWFPGTPLGEQAWAAFNRDLPELLRAFAWRHHLLSAGLDPDQGRGPGAVAITSSLPGKMLVPIRRADLWLVSNVPALRGSPYPLRLDRGVPFRNISALPDPNLNRPLI